MKNGDVTETLTNPIANDGWTTQTASFSGGNIVQWVVTETDGVVQTTNYASNGSYVETLLDTKNAYDWSSEVQTFNSANVEVEIDDKFHDGSSINTSYDGTTGDTTRIETYNPDGSYTDEKFLAAGNSSGEDTTTGAYNASGVIVEQAYTYYNGNVEVFKYNDSGIIESHVLWTNDPSSSLLGNTETDEYDSAGDLQSERIDSANGAVSITSYYANHNLESVVTKNVNGSGKAMGYADTSTAGSFTGAQISEVDENSDGSKVVKGWDPSGTQPWIDYTVTYNADGSVYDSQFLLKDSVQNQAGVWVPSQVLFDSLHPTDQATLLITAAELIEQNESQPTNNKHDVQQRVTLPDGENYLVTVLANGQVFYKNEHGTFFSQIINPLETVVTAIVDIVAAIYQQYWVIAATSAVDGATQLAEGNYLAGALDLVAAIGAGVAAVGSAGIESGTTAIAGGAGEGGAAGQAAVNAGSAAVAAGQDILAGVSIGAGLETIVLGAENGNVLTAVTGAVEAASAGLIGFQAVGQDVAIGIELGQAVLSSSEGLASGNVVAAFAGASQAVSALYSPSGSSAASGSSQPATSGAGDTENAAVVYSSLERSAGPDGENSSDGSAVDLNQSLIESGVKNTSGGIYINPNTGLPDTTENITVAPGKFVDDAQIHHGFDGNVWIEQYVDARITSLANDLMYQSLSGLVSLDMKAVEQGGAQALLEFGITSLVDQLSAGIESKAAAQALADGSTGIAAGTLPLQLTNSGSKIYVGSGGPLATGLQNTFAGGKYTTTVLAEPITLYRVWSPSTFEFGGFWTTIKPVTSAEAIEDLALLPSWGNSATNLTTIEVPVGTLIYSGYAAPQASLLGEGIQVYISDVSPSWKVGNTEFLPTN